MALRLSSHALHRKWCAAVVSRCNGTGASCEGSLKQDSTFKQASGIVEQHCCLTIQTISKQFFWFKECRTIPIKGQCPRLFAGQKTKAHNRS
jgi:hypothetical protein